MVSSLLVCAFLCHLTRICVTEASAEEHRYVAKLAKEKKAFETLIRIKSEMVIQLHDSAEDVYRHMREDAAHETQDTRTLQQFQREGSSSNNIASSSSLHSNNTMQTHSLTRAHRLLSQQGLAVVVDVREFRSSLPSLLHASGFRIVPRTLQVIFHVGLCCEINLKMFQVGDYVLSPEICIERKGISDLFGSFASGRLYTQAESMCRYYKYPCLLIEFGKERGGNGMILQAASDISTDSIQMAAISSKLSMLALAFPNLRYLWSRSALFVLMNVLSLF